MIALVHLVAGCLILSTTLVADWSFDTDDSLDGWQVSGTFTHVEVKHGVLSARLEQEAGFLFQDALAIQTTPYQFIELRIKASRPGEGTVFWIGDQGLVWEHRGLFQITRADEWQTVRLYPFWQNRPEIKQLRLSLYPDAIFELDSIVVKNWTEKPIAPLEQYAWTFNEDWGDWLETEHHPVIFAPPVRLELADRRVAQVRMQSSVDFQAMVAFTPEAYPVYLPIPFNVIGDGVERTYNVSLYMHYGRAGFTWRDPILVLGLHIPQEYRDVVNVRHFALQEKPEGTAIPAVKYLGLDSAVNRAGRPFKINAEIQNQGGSVTEDANWTARLVLPEGLQPVSVQTLELAVPVVTSLHSWETLSWEVLAEVPGTYPITLEVQGADAVRSMTADVRVESPLERSQVSYVPVPEPVKTLPDIFAYYFPGWNEYKYWDCIHRFAPERKPWLGYYDESKIEVVDWQIKAAVENGIDGFVLDWYWGDDGLYLNHWLDAYAASRYRDNLEIMLMWCNHVGTFTHEDLQTIIGHCAEHYFPWPSYYKIDNKPVFIIWDTARLRNQFWGEAGVRDALAIMEAAAQSYGFEGLYFIESGMHMGLSPGRIARIEEQGFNAFTSYHEWLDASALAPASHAVDFADIVQTAPATWRRYNSATADTQVTYIPVIESGWDSHPWHGLNPNRQALINRTPALFEDLLRHAGAYHQEYNPPFLLIGPINEWGEGSYIEPSVDYGFGMFEAIRNALGEGSTAQWPVNLVPEDVGMGPYDIPPPPACSAWVFEEDTLGWSPLQMIDDFQVTETGILLTPTRNDGAIGVNAPLNLDHFKRLEIVMQTENLSEAATARFFWATPWGDFNIARMATFPLEADNGILHTYAVPLKEIPTWNGHSPALRLDPCSQIGVRVRIKSIHLE